MLNLGKNRLVSHISWLTVGLLLFSAPMTNHATAEEKTVAVVGEEEITLKDLEHEIARYGKSKSFQKKLLTLTPEGKKKILDEFVNEKLFFLGAREKGIKLDEQEERELKRLRTDLMIRKYIQNEMKDHPLSDEEMRVYYEKNREEFTIPEKRKVRHIVAETEQKARRALSDLKEGRDFSLIASEVNIDGTKERDGDMGWIERGMMVKEFEDVAFRMEEDAVSDIVRTRFGYHIIQVQDIRTREIKTFESSKNAIERKLEELRLSQMEKHLRNKFGVKVNETVLQEILMNADIGNRDGN